MENTSNNKLTGKFVNALLKLRVIAKTNPNIELKINENNIIVVEDSKWKIQGNEEYWNPTFTEIQSFLSNFKEYEIEVAILDLEQEILNN